MEGFEGFINDLGAYDATLTPHTTERTGEANVLPCTWCY